MGVAGESGRIGDGGNEGVVVKVVFLEDEGAEGLAVGVDNEPVFVGRGGLLLLLRSGILRFCGVGRSLVCGSTVQGGACALAKALLHARDVADAESCGEDGDFDVFVEVLVIGDTPDDLDVLVAEFVHELVEFLHLRHQERVSLALVDVEEDFLGVIDIVVVEQGRVERLVDGSCQTMLALAETIAHDGNAAVLEHLLHIAEVEVDGAAHGDELSDALDGDGEDFVCFGETGVDVHVGIDLEETLVVDDE